MAGNNTDRVMRGFMRIEKNNTKNYRLIKGEYKHIARTIKPGSLARGIELSNDERPDKSKEYFKDKDGHLVSPSDFNGYLVRAEDDDIEKKLKDRLLAFGYNSYGKDNTKKTIKSNQIPCFEIICDFPPEMADKINFEEWCKDCMKWARSEFECSNPKEMGSNIVAAAFHADEEANAIRDDNGNLVGIGNNYHLHIMIQPIDKEGRLNCSGMLGNKYEFERRQDTYYEMVSKKHGLARGKHGEQTPHNRSKEWNAKMSKERAKGRLNIKENDTVQSLHERAQQTLDQVCNTHFREKDLLEREKADLKYELKQARKEKDEINELLEDTKKQLGKLQKDANSFQMIKHSLENNNSISREDKQYYSDIINNLIIWAVEDLEKKRKREQEQEEMNARIMEEE